MSKEQYVIRLEGKDYRYGEVFYGREFAVDYARTHLLHLKNDSDSFYVARVGRPQVTLSKEDLTQFVSTLLGKQHQVSTEDAQQVLQGTDNETATHTLETVNSALNELLKGVCHATDETEHKWVEPAVTHENLMKLRFSPAEARYMGARTYQVINLGKEWIVIDPEHYQGDSTGRWTTLYSEEEVIRQLNQSIEVGNLVIVGGNDNA